MIEIRKEEKRDYEQVYLLIKKAFKEITNSNKDEQELVNKLRNSSNFIPELSLVAEKDNKIVGYILFTKVKIGKRTELALVPLAVLPEFQKQGIGKKLIQKGHEIAKKLGYSYIVVLGSENYYPKFGYIPAINYNIKPPFDVPSKNFMAIKLTEEKEKISGIVEYAKEFEI